MKVNTDHLKRCMQTLQSSLRFYAEAEENDISQEVYRNAVVKSFELCLEISGKLLRRSLKEFGYSHNTVDKWIYKDVLRYAAKHGLMEAEALARWFAYRDNRNSTAHDYGVGFANETIVLVQQFMQDVSTLESVIRSKFDQT